MTPRYAPGVGQADVQETGADLSLAEHAEWVASARRIAPLVDGIEYYRHLRRALIEARREVLIVGWDFHSEIDLLRGHEAERAEREDGWPVRLADLLERVVREREQLHVRILIWEGASLFALERQHLPRMKRPGAGNPRLRLEWDRGTPVLGSQHEKLVTIDGRIAFVGGMDLTRSRWDAHPHEPDDERRRNPGLVPTYGAPYHDVMLALDGEAAEVLARWARERWRRATEERLEAPEPVDSDPWPPALDPLLEDRDVAFVRTQPAHAGRDEKRQVEASYLAQVRAARRLVYVETQYLTHSAFAEALAERLRDPEGPEVVLILPHGCPGVLQSMAMDTFRDGLLDLLREADPGGRLAVFWPTLSGGEEEDVHENAVYVHAKTLVIDDRLMRIGSSNLNNRSMGLDAELDAFVLVGADEGDAVAAIASYRRRLIAYLLHVEPERVARAEREQRSVVAAIESLRGGQHSLEPFEHRAREILHELRLPIELSDPGCPLAPEDAERVLQAIRESTPVVAKARKAANVAIGGLRRSKGLLAAVVVLVALVLAWRFTPLRDLVDTRSTRDSIEALRASPLGLAGVLLVFVLLAAVGFPVTVLVAAVGATFQAATGAVLAIVGVAGAATASFLVGRALRGRVRRTDRGERLSRIGRRFANRGVLAIAILRNVPIAPFALVNLACGMTHLGFGAYLTGTMIGMFPGIVLMCVFGQEIGRWLGEPTLEGLLPAIAVAALVVVAALGADVGLRRWGRGKDKDEDERSRERAAAGENDTERT